MLNPNEHTFSLPLLWETGMKLAENLLYAAFIVFD